MRKKIFLKYFVIWNTILYLLMLMNTSNWQGVGPVSGDNTEYIFIYIYIFFFGGGGGGGGGGGFTKKCNLECDQALIKSSLRSV